MSTKRASSPKTSHHAYLILGERSAPTVIGINEARELRQRAQLATAGEEIAISCQAITEEAQNALLKTLEEPALGIVFRIYAPTSIQLLPTFLSRVEIIRTENNSETDFAEIKKFLNANLEARFKIIADLIKKAGEEHKSAGINFLNDLEKYLAQNLKLEKASADIIFALSEIRQGRMYLHDKSGTPKLILDHVALVLPGQK